MRYFIAAMSIPLANHEANRQECQTFSIIEKIVFFSSNLIEMNLLFSIRSILSLIPDAS